MMVIYLLVAFALATFAAHPIWWGMYAAIAVMEVRQWYKMQMQQRALLHSILSVQPDDDNDSKSP